MNGNVPGFLLKLVNLLESTKFQEHVSWSGDGKAFIIKNPTTFAKDVLPAYFKHNKFQSFVRQLNLYGFRKVVIFDHNILPVPDDAVVFHHPHFIKNRRDLLYEIKRKNAQSRQNLLTLDEAEDILDDVSNLKENQIQTNKSLSSLRQENEDLWREVVSLRQKHSKQQKIMDHLIKFLVSLVQHQGKGPKRKFPLMIEKRTENDFHLHKKARPHQVPPASSNTVGNSDMTNASTSRRPLIKKIQGSSHSSTLKGAVNNANTNSFSQNVPVSSVPSTKQLDVLQFISAADDSAQLDGHNNVNLSPSLLEENHQNGFENVGNEHDSSAVEPSSYFNLPNEDNGTSLCSSQARSPLPSIPSAALSSLVSSENSPQCSSKSTVSSGESSSVSTSSKIKSNLKVLQEKLSNNEPIQLDCDLIQELFYGFIDLSPHSRLIDESLFSNPSPSVSGTELVQYSSDSPADRANSHDAAEQVDLDELCKLFNE